MALPKGRENPTEELSVSRGSCSRGPRDDRQLLTEGCSWEWEGDPDLGLGLKSQHTPLQMAERPWTSRFRLAGHTLWVWGRSWWLMNVEMLLEIWHNPSIFIIVHYAGNSHINEVITLHRSGIFISLRVINSKTAGHEVSMIWRKGLVYHRRGKSRDCSKPLVHILF